MFYFLTVMNPSEKNIDLECSLQGCEAQQATSQSDLERRQEIYFCDSQQISYNFEL